MIRHSNGCPCPCHCPWQNCNHWDDCDFFEDENNNHGGDIIVVINEGDGNNFRRRVRRTPFSGSFF